MLITLPITSYGQLLVKSGDKVEIGQPLFKNKKTNEVKIDLSQSLGVAPDKIFNYLKKFVGDTIKKEDLLAEKKTFISRKAVYAELDGVLKEIDHKDGYLLLEVNTDEEQTLSAYFKGEIVEINKEKMTIKVENGKVFNLKEAKEDFGGKVFYSTKDSFDNDEVEDKVVVTEKITSYNQTKMEALGAHGFVSVHHLQEKKLLPLALVKNIDDWKEIINLKFPYCLIIAKENKIYFYN